MRKSTFCICENKDADQLRGNREADQRLCFRYIGSTIPLLSKSEISSLYPSSVAVKTVCVTRSGNQNVGFLKTRLICVAKTKGLISCTVTTQLILYLCLFAYAKKQVLP